MWKRKPYCLFWLVVSLVFLNGIIVRLMGSDIDEALSSCEPLEREYERVKIKAASALIDVLLKIDLTKPNMLDRFRNGLERLGKIDMMAACGVILKRRMEFDDNTKEVMIKSTLARNEANIVLLLKIIDSNLNGHKYKDWFLSERQKFAVVAFREIQGGNKLSILSETAFELLKSDSNANAGIHDNLLLQVGIELQSAKRSAQQSTPPEPPRAPQKLPDSQPPASGSSTPPPPPSSSPPPP